jgi:drug/metabolite transporter (DMT)-like permease
MELKFGMGSRAWGANGMLLLAALLWGLGFVAQRAGAEFVSPFWFNTIRFGIGTLALVPAILLRPRPLGKRQLKLHWGGGVLLGLLVASAVGFQQFGMQTTTAGKAGFIVGMYMVLVPLLGIALGHRPGWGSWLGVLVSAIGLYFLSVQSDFRMDPGDLLLLASAGIYAVQVLLVAWLSPQVDALWLAWVEFATCMVASLACALIFEPFSWQGVQMAWFPLLYSGLGAVAIAFTLQILGQRNANPTHASIIMNLESVFAAVGGWLILGEILSSRSLLGGALMFMGVFLARLKP